MTEKVKFDRHLVVLAHGILKDSKDMEFLEGGLLSRGFKTISVDLPLTFGTLEEACKSLEKQIEMEFNSYDVVHFVGYSMGGLVIQRFLSMNKLNNIGYCVFIGTPNRGSKLANIFAAIPGLEMIFKPLKDLKTSRTLDDIFKHNKNIKIGVIAGTKNDPLHSRLLLSPSSDGMVEVHSAKLDKMHEFTHFPYAHKNIHFQEDVLTAVCSFLKNGTFKTT